MVENGRAAVKWCGSLESDVELDAISSTDPSEM
jgi:hypothetical protein